MTIRTEHKAPQAGRSDAARIHKIGFTFSAPRDWIKHMAELLKIDRQTVQRWLAGEVEPSAGAFTDLRKIAADHCREIGEVVK